jgi:hypothetical protein
VTIRLKRAAAARRSARWLNDVRYLRFPRFKCATLLVEAIVSIIMCGMHTCFGRARSLMLIYCLFGWHVRDGARQSSRRGLATELLNSITAASTSQAIHDFYKKYATPADSFARCVLFAMSQPEDVDVNEILLRPTSQEL